MALTAFNVLSHPITNLPSVDHHADSSVRRPRRNPHPNHENVQRRQMISWKEEGRVGKMKEMLRKDVELSVSPYDTAWVAMVGSREQEQQLARFPQCLRWVAENQQADGSWASHPADPLLVKDSLSSTLASVLALRSWGIGDQLVNRGLEFIRSNAWAATDKNQRTPTGFDIIFPGMMESATALGLNLPFNPSTFQAMLQKRDLLLQNGDWTSGKRADVAYAAEGLATMARFNGGGGGGQWKWEEVLRKHQRKNGSLFNSPSTTAAALLHLHDAKSLAYLDSVLSTFKNSPAVPTVFPLDVLSRLEMVDNLVKLGIHQYFTPQIALILDDIYKCWIQRDDELFSDIGCLAKGFRLLRVNGYHVSSEVFEGLDREEDYFDSVLTQYKSTDTILELYKASLTTILQSEPILDGMKDWTSSYLRRTSLSSASLNVSDKEQRLAQEVEYALRFPYASLERIENRLSMEIADVDEDVKLLKTSYSCSNKDDKKWLEFAVEDFNKCQSLQRKELKVLERWVKDYRIEELKFARQKVAYGFFAAAAILFLPEHAEARSSWAKNTVLVTLIDDLFDIGGSEEELLNFIDLVKAWDGYESVGFCSEQVEIIFKAVYDATNEYVAKASLVQGRCVKHHFMEMWLVLLDCMWQEYVRGRDKIIPTMEEYIATGYVSVALGPVILVPMYFLGCNLSEEAMQSKEYDDLFMHVSVIARLLNDLATIGRESAQGKENSLALGMMRESGKGKVTTEEEARREIQGMIEKHRKELLRMVVLKEGVVPRAVKEVFWQTSKIVHMFYMSKDGFSSPHEMVAAIDSVIYKPIVLPHTTTLRHHDPSPFVICVYMYGLAEDLDTIMPSILTE